MGAAAAAAPPGTGAPVDEPRDCNGDLEWKRFVEPRALYAAWSPPPASPWSGYAKPTLFAASGGSDVRPAPWRGLASAQAATSRVRLPEGTAVVLDLPGAWSVAMGAWLARAAGLQPVVLANNWPHPKGVVDAGAMLAALLHYAPWAAQDAELRAKAPPVFILDRDRLGARQPKPGDFDNRYFLMETDLPSPARLARGGVQRVLYVTPEALPAPPPPRPSVPESAWGKLSGHDLLEEARLRAIVERLPDPVERPPDLDDVNRWLVEARKSLGLGVARADMDEWRVKDARDFAPAPRKTVFTTVKDPAFAGFRRSALGGFGKIVPEPSSGGSGFG